MPRSRWILAACALLLAAANLLAGAVYAGPREALETARRGDFLSASRELMPLAERGDKDAQFVLGLIYENGLGTPKNLNKAAGWFAKAAESGHGAAARKMGDSYLYGIGVDKDPIEARRWYEMAARAGDQTAMNRLTALNLTHGAPQRAVPAQAVQGAQIPMLPDLPQGGAPQVAAVVPPAGGDMKTKFNSGTGFVISSSGHILTNHHVVRDCGQIQVKHRDVVDEATLVAHERDVDLALLRALRIKAAPAVFRIGAAIRPGEDIIVYGFPLADFLSVHPVLTKGSISSLAGFRGDPNHMQISAPVQSGNSGGPLLDMAGRVVGVVDSKINALAMAQVTGDLTQNMNFAIKGAVAVRFLIANGLKPFGNDDMKDMSAAQVGDRAARSTVFILCRQH